jgi:cobalt-zinc-cadmium efflux system membrane fusion protein
MRKFSLRRALLAAASLCVSQVALACHREPEAAVASTPAHPDEVWIDPGELARAAIELSPITEHDVEDQIYATGKISFDDERVTHVYSPVTGRVSQITAKLGQRVKKGGGLALIQSPDLGQASSDLGKAEADLIAAEHDLKRKQELYETHAASAADVETSEDNFRKAKAEKQRAEQKSALFHVDGNNVTQGYTLASPINGEVIASFVNPGVEVQGQYGGGSAVELFTVGELDKVWAIADVYEMDLSRIAPGDSVALEVVAQSGRFFHGTLDWVSGTIDPTTRTTRVRCVFDNADRALKPEMFATIGITTRRRSIPSIPRNAIFRMGTGLYAFAAKGTAPTGELRLARVPVQIDEQQTGDWVPLPTTIPRDAQIVTSNSIMLIGML